MPSLPIPISGVPQYRFDDSSSEHEHSISSGRTSPSSEPDFARSIYGISELLSLAPLGASQFQYTDQLQRTFPEIVRAPRHPDDLADHLDHLTLHSHTRTRRSRKPKPTEGAQQQQPRPTNPKRSHKWKPHHAPNHPSSNPSSVEDTPGWTTVHHFHGSHNPNHVHPPASSSPPTSKPKRSQHGFRPTSAWMSHSSVRGSQIDAMASWR